MNAFSLLEPAVTTGHIVSEHAAPTEEWGTVCTYTIFARVYSDQVCQYTGSVLQSACIWQFPSQTAVCLSDG